MKDSELFQDFLNYYCSMKSRKNIKDTIRQTGLIKVSVITIGLSLAALLKVVIGGGDILSYMIMFWSIIYLVIYFYMTSPFTLSELIDCRIKMTRGTYNMEDDFFESLATSHSVPDKFKKIVAQELESSNCVTWDFVLKLLKETKRSDAHIEQSTKPGAEKLKEYADK